jgi:hypothetical protein
LRLLIDSRVLVLDAPVCAFLLLTIIFVGEIKPAAEKGWEEVTPPPRGEVNIERVCPKGRFCDLVVRDPLAVT